MKSANLPEKPTWIGSRLDRFFEAFAPQYALSRAEARAKLFAYRAAQPSLNRELAVRSAHPNSSLVQRDAVTMMFESRDLCENVGFAKGHLRKVQLYSAGTITYEPETGDAGMDSEISDYWQEWCKRAHIGSEHTFNRLIQLAVMGMTRDRDSMLVFCRDEFDALRLQIVEADQIGELFSFANAPGYIQGVFMEGPCRTGYRVYDRTGDLQYSNPQFIDAHNAVFFYDPMRSSVRGITAYDTCIQNIRDKYEILGYEKIIVKEISTRGIVTYTQRGQADKYDIDRQQVQADGSISYIRHAESGVQEYMGVGENFEVIAHNRPSPTFQGFIKTLDMEDCQGLNLPYGFVVDISENGGAAARLIAHVADREFGRQQNDIITPNLDKIRTIVLADAMERREISTHRNFRKGFWMYPPPATADVQRESDISIRECRAGLSTRTGEWAAQGGSFRKKVKILRDEEVARRVAAREAGEMLASLGYADEVVSPNDIYANSDNPPAPAAEEDIAAAVAPDASKASNANKPKL